MNYPFTQMIWHNVFPCRADVFAAGDFRRARKNKNPGEFPHRGSGWNDRLGAARSPQSPSSHARGYLSFELLIAVRGMAGPFL
ncbi:hypothetical protein GN109_15770 [Collimonas pratensis]|uniref:hypothetical protein n=1 Tax=Collimonas pratensis TaxID=279113 RepID=UPI00143D0AAD|nr:hypothetical protein [Collimonas pratensis]NKI70882.1 hypothetical protein [Collimonas pratensis]